MPNKHAVAIFAIDPGETTGCGAGLFDLRQQTVLACMRRAQFKGNIFSWEVNGDHVSQAWEMALWYRDWQYKIHVENNLIAARNFYIVQEDFIPRQLNFNPQSLLVIGAWEALWAELSRKIGEGYVEYRRQQPNEQWKDDQWLKQNGLWVRSDHERSARRHIARKLDSLL